jgi:predicted transcriptional regulator
MTTSDAISLYRTQEKLAHALGITQAAVAMWGEYPPARRQMQLERITRGRLRAEPEVFNPKIKRAA